MYSITTNKLYRFFSWRLDFHISLKNILKKPLPKLFNEANKRTLSFVILPLIFETKANIHISRQTTTQKLDFVNNLLYNVIQPLPFKIYPEDIYSFPLIREYHDSHLFYLDAQNNIAEAEEPRISIKFCPTTPFHHSTSKKTYIPLIFQHQSRKVSLQLSIYLKISTNFQPKLFFVHLLYKHSYKRKHYFKLKILNATAQLTISHITD